MIIVGREEDIVDKEVPYQIWIQDIYMADLVPGEKKSFSLKKGDYHIQIKSFDKKSNIISFSVSKDNTIEFLCKPKKKTIFHKFLKGKNEIFLELKQDIVL